jgi:hypothetical protein
LNQPDKLKVQNALGNQAVIDAAEMEGIGAEATNERLQTYNSAFALSAINTATGSSAEEGQAMLDKYGAQLEGPDKIKIEKTIATKVAAEKTASDASQSVLTATKLTRQYDSRSDVVAEVNKIKDDDLRKQTMSEAMSQISRRNQAESEDRAASYEAADTAIGRQGTSVVEYKANNGESWNKLSPGQKRKLEKGEPTTTDQVVFTELGLMSDDKLKNIDPTDYITDLSPTDYKTLVKDVRSARGLGSESDKIDRQVGRTRTTQTTAASSQIFGPPADYKNNRGKKERFNQFHSLLDAEVKSREAEKGSSLSSDEFTNVLAGFTREVVQAGTFFDSEFDFNEVVEKFEGQTFEGSPVQSLLLEKMKKDGTPITTDNLLRYYQSVKHRLD